MRDPDVLDLAAWEHRELHRALRALVDDEGAAIAAEHVDPLLSSVARHEALDRLLLYPLVDRDAGGRRSLIERRAEQRSISDQLVKVRRLLEASAAAHSTRLVLASLQRTFTGHSDREEIEDFPQARRWSSVSERHELAELRAELRELLQERLPHVPSTRSRSDELPAERLGPVQIAIVDAKQILRDLDRTIVGAA